MLNPENMKQLMDITMVSHWLTEHFGAHWTDCAPKLQAFIIGDVLTTACADHKGHMQSAIDALDAKIDGGENLEAHARELAVETHAMDVLMTLGEVLAKAMDARPEEPITTEPAFSRN